MEKLLNLIPVSGLIPGGNLIRDNGSNPDSNYSPGKYSPSSSVKFPQSQFPRTKLPQFSLLPLDKSGAVSSSAVSSDAVSADTDSSSFESIWQTALVKIASSLDPQLFAVWIKPLVVEAIVKTDAGLSVRLSAPNKFCVEHIQRSYAELIRNSLSEIACNEISLFLTARPTVLSADNSRLSVSRESVSSKQTVVMQSAASLKTAISQTTSLQSTHSNSQVEHGITLNKTRKVGPEAGLNINPRYNFSNFVVGGCNQLAHAASLRVSESLGQSYNPLFLYGGVGLGKTHLANAIGNASLRRGKRLLFVSSEAFVSELVSSLRNKRMEEFRKKFRSLDLLIIDDIQFILGKECTQEEFFHTFNELHNHHKQIVITCDRIPQELTGLEQRLRTRFSSGLAVDLQTPDFETRVAILSKKAESLKLALPDEVARLLAQAVDTNIRELEGMLNRLLAFSSLQNSPVTLQLAEAAIRSIPRSEKPPITAEIIQRRVAEKYSVSLNDIIGKRRTQNIALARQVAMYLCRRLTAYSYPEIGAFFGGRDHSTVIHAYRSVSNRLCNDASLGSSLKELEAGIRC